MRVVTRGSAAAAILLLVACASALKPGSEATTARFERTVGTGSATDLMSISTRVIRQNNFEIYKEDGAPRIYIETRWKDRYPFDDEQMLGATKAQTRLILRGTSHGSTPLGPLFRLDLSVENRLELGVPDQWTGNHVTPEYRKYADKLTEDLRRELDVALRRH